MVYQDMDYFAPSRPIDVKGGIKAQSQRGGFGKSWWAKRWMEVLNTFNIESRLGRGRSYARKGQVLSVEIEKGLVKSRVQGSRERPYSVTVEVATIAGADWNEIAEELNRPDIAAALLAGQMPENMESVFSGIGMSLFPNKSADLMTKCSCPDISNPCKHIAAVYLLVGEEFDRDPFLIFNMRGLSREEMVGLIEEDAGLAEEAKPFWFSRGLEASVSAPVELAADPEGFWSSPAGNSDPHEVAAEPTTPALLPKQLGSFPFWKGEKAFIASMEKIYKNAAVPDGL